MWCQFKLSKKDDDFSVLRTLREEGFYSVYRYEDNEPSVEYSGYCLDLSLYEYVWFIIRLEGPEEWQKAHSILNKPLLYFADCYYGTDCYGKSIMEDCYRK